MSWPFWWLKKNEEKAEEHGVTAEAVIESSIPVERKIPATKKMLTKNFSLAELACIDATRVPEAIIPNVTDLAQNLQVLRDYLGQPVGILSGYRTPTYNKKVGGAKFSQHLQAKAADLTTKSKTPKQLAAIIEKLIKEGKMKQGGVGVYSTFVHYDTRGNKARW